jgi:uncharacterized lipoprotein YehR (DUF1307 family)
MSNEIQYTTREAFEKLISERNWHTKIEGLKPETGRTLKNSFKTGKITIDKMEDLLTKAGFTVIQEKLWNF